MSSSSVSGLSERPRMNSVKISGACESETTVLKATAAPTRSSTAAEAIAERASTGARSATVMERSTTKLTSSA